jgi:hypothetical protein
MLLLCHPGRKLVAIIVVDWCVVGLRAPSPLLLLLLVLAGLRGGEGRGRAGSGDGSLFRGIDMGMVLNLKSGHCM